MEINEKQEHILNIAQKLFAEHGFSGTSVRDIAQTANVNISMISYYFGGKEGLLKAIVSSKTQHIKANVENIIADDSLTSQEKLDAYIDKTVTKFWENRALYKMSIREQDFKMNPELKDSFCEVRSMRFEQFSLLIKQGQKSGVFSKNVSLPLMQATITGILKHIYFSDEYYFELLGIEKKENKEELILTAIKNYIKTVLKLLLNENHVQ